MVGNNILVNGAIAPKSVGKNVSVIFLVLKIIIMEYLLLLILIRF
jgi:hypothetical protein